MDAEDDLDPTLFKKKKKKKKPFDPDAARSLDVVDQAELNEDIVSVDGILEDDLVDSDFPGKKKKKKKKPTDVDESNETLPQAKEKPEPEEEHFSFDLDFSTAKKKKKSKKKDLDQLVIETPQKEDANDKDDVQEAASSWANSDRDYTYDELLKRAFDIIFEKNPDMASGRKQKFIMRPPQVLRVGTKKTSFANFMDIAKALHRMPKHLLDFLLAELGTSGSMDGNQQLIIKGRFQPKQIENVLRRYIKEYVTCHTCRSPATILQKETRLFFLQCESCGSRCSVAGIKSGFQAVTGKRAALRARAN